MTESFSERDTTPRAETVYVLFHSLPFVSEQECERVASGMDAALASGTEPENTVRLFMILLRRTRRAPPASEAWLFFAHFLFP